MSILYAGSQSVKKFVMWSRYLTEMKQKLIHWRQQETIFNITGNLTLTLLLRLFSSVEPLNQTLFPLHMNRGKNNQNLFLTRSSVCQTTCCLYHQLSFTYVHNENNLKKFLFSLKKIWKNFFLIFFKFEKNLKKNKKNFFSSCFHYVHM